MSEPPSARGDETSLGVARAPTGSVHQQAGEAEVASPERAFEVHFDMVWRTLRRLGVPLAHLDDATQDVFLVVHRRWADFRGQSSVKTWVYGVSLRVASDYVRRARRDRSRHVEELPDVVSPADSPDRLYQQREAGRLLHASLSELEEPERQIMVLVDLEERSVVEASEALGINLNTAYSRLRRARLRFERALRAQRHGREAGDAAQASKRDERG